MRLTDLPYTIFLEIVSYLSAADVLVCRRLSSDARQALTRSDLCVSLILAHFPRSREGRLLRRCFQDAGPRGRHGLLDGDDWAAVFARLARRYFHLGNAVPWRTDKIPLLKDPARLRGVTPWNRFLRLDEKTAPFHYWDPVWTFSPADGLLVYPAAPAPAPAPAPASGALPEPAFRARDLATGSECPVPFDMTGKVVRRVRLSDGILIFEWCETTPHSSPDEQEATHRHFATAYDITRAEGYTTSLLSSSYSSQTPGEFPWTIHFRSEWKIHFLGLPLSRRDRFFSTHNRTHYVLYIWQPTRSPWGEDDPLERLIVWEIGNPCSHRPSLDPTQKEEPPSGGGPRIVRRLANQELAAWGIEQKDTPSLRGLALDPVTWDSRTGSACGHIYFTEEEHRWSAGPHSSPAPPRLHRVKATGIPLLGHGPRWLDDCGGNSSNRNVNMTFCRRGPWRRRRSNNSSMRAHATDDDIASETWPGRAPCWRHDDFPYLTVAEVFDAAAGVRISARHCFMLETLSVHIRPRLRVQGVEAVYAAKSGRKRTASANSGSGSGSSSSSSSSSEGTATPGDVGSVATSAAKGGTIRAEGPYGEEVQFDDDMWGELLGKGFISGDERWLVGEDGNGDITVVYF
ncbi:hypothetical protein S40288_11446 [Stachybotrys chartarum IBT 40288]|nr:hypothetical protein S40288_11446 [Stachybotrys chartarum IBT 40288]